MNINWKHKSVLKLVAEQGETYGTDPIEIVRGLTRDLVLKAFTKEWSGPPFDMIQLAKLLQMDVMPNELVNDARIIPQQKGKFLIEYNPFQNPSRASFSIAHEIGHSLFSDCAETIRYRSKTVEDYSWELELLCNVAAAEILLPYALFAGHANKVPLTLDSLIGLATKYQASLESVFIRFCEVVDKPCMVILAKFNEDNELELDYVVRSESFKIGALNKGYTIPKSSIAYECMKSGWTSYKLENWDIFGKQANMVFAVGLPALKKQKEPRAGILIVPQEYEESISNEVYTVRGDATEPRGQGKRIIVQLVNTGAAVGIGFGKAMAQKYPASKKALEQWKEKKKGFALGQSQLVNLGEDIFVFQMVAQHGVFPKYGEIPLKYDSLRMCLEILAIEAKSLGASVHMPMIGAGQAKGDWEIIKGIINEELIKKEVDVTVYILPGTKQDKKQSETLSLFE